MKTVALPSGERVPAFGEGTWHMAENVATRAEEIATLRLALDLGATLIDTAEMYGDGRSEELIGAAIGHRRDEAFLVSKVLPQHASLKGTIAACEGSLRRLGTDRLDLYLLHWRGSIPFAETMQAFIVLQRAGKIRHYGVSNLDSTTWRSSGRCPAAARYRPTSCSTTSRGAASMGPAAWLRERRIPVMAYSPIEQARLLRNAWLVHFARRHGLTSGRSLSLGCSLTTMSSSSRRRAAGTG